MALDQIDTGTGYSRPEGHHNARLTEVGRGKPMGELMRRYWLPVGLADYATDLPRRVRALGEDLVLFRDKQGRAGLVYDRCCHRGTSLMFGRVEDDGIRCCYHGWKFDGRGHCLEQPGEPDAGRFKDKVRQPWYPVQERYGLIWAYMGPPQKKPLLPRYNVFEELEEDDQLYTDDNNIGAPCPEADVPFNWLQHYENIHDPAHFYWLHYLHSGPQFGSRFGEIDLDTLKDNIPALVAGIEYETNDRGVTARRTMPLPDGRVLHTVVETALPALRVVPNPFGTPGRVDHIGFILPVDDTHFKIFTVLRGKDRGFFDFFDKLRLEGRNDRPMEERQRFPNDLEAQGGQGPITLHSEEHLATSDKGVVMLRRLFEAQMKSVEDGADPIGVHFEPGSEHVRLEGGSFLSGQIRAAE